MALYGHEQMTSIWRAKPNRMIILDNRPLTLKILRGTKVILVIPLRRDQFPTINNIGIN